LHGKIKAVLLVLLAVCVVVLPFLFTPTAKPVSASAYAGDVMTINRYDVDMTVQTDRKIVVKETIVMTANESGSLFTRSLPMEGNRYLDVSAQCVGEEAKCYVEDEDDFLNVVCELYTKKNTTRTYEIAYTMVSGRNDVKNGMQIDVIGFGWTVALHNVTVKMHFPSAVNVESKMITRYGEETPSKAFSYEYLSSDGRELVLKADVLEKYRNVYGETVAEGIYVRFSLEAGVLQDFTATQVFTEDTWKILVVGGVCLLLAFVFGKLLCKRREVISTVNISAPDDMDPMTMGKLIDGNVDNEDITSMIYYFAHKGYLTIDLSDEENVSFTALVSELPETSTVHERTLFEGLFQKGETVCVSDLKEKFYKSVDCAKRQLITEPMYEKKSVFMFLLGGIMGLLIAFLLPFWLGKTRIGSGYSYFFGFIIIIPIIGIWLIAYIRENYRYKWKRGKKMGLLLAEIGVAVGFSLLFIFAVASHIMTRWEKLYLCLLVMAMTFTTLGALTRTEKYGKKLGQILGFKEFILFTEAEKIKFMLEENPQLYYKVLPYAQVLGVTDEWEKKFKGILIEPPTWCGGTRLTVFDYVLINRCLRRSMVIAMMRAQSKGGGSFIGRSGGGGNFGGFGGGGFGGGGGSWR